MPVIQLSEPPKPASPSNRLSAWRPFGLGFRPFFLLAGLAAVVLLPLWLVLWHETGLAESWQAAKYYGAVGWHSHEMLFGYATAVIGGFLLTAVRNWTGLPTPSGARLAALALVWLAGRLLPWLPGIPAPLVAAVDMAFLPLLAAALVPPLWAGKNRMNRIFLPLLLAMATANGLVHAEALGWGTTLAARGANIMLDLVLLLLIIVAGRVVPFFAEKAVAGVKPVRRQWVETAGFVLMPLLAILHLTGAPGIVTGPVYIAVGLAQATRLAGWHDPRVWRVPVLAVLYAGYVWLVAGLLLSGLGDFGLVPRTLALHALTIGAVGTLTLGMMARVALGHTGRSIDTTRPINAAFVLLNLAAFVRVVGPWAIPAFYAQWIDTAGTLWICAFGIFAVVYTPILLRPRADGRPD